MCSLSLRYVCLCKLGLRYGWLFYLHNAGPLARQVQGEEEEGTPTGDTKRGRWGQSGVGLGGEEQKVGLSRLGPVLCRTDIDQSCQPGPDPAPIYIYLTPAPLPVAAAS